VLVASDALLVAAESGDDEPDANDDAPAASGLLLENEALRADDGNELSPGLQTTLDDREEDAVSDQSSVRMASDTLPGDAESGDDESDTSDAAAAAAGLLFDNEALRADDGDELPPALHGTLDDREDVGGQRDDGAEGGGPVGRGLLFDN
jgi:hypothetical protein